MNATSAQYTLMTLLDTDKSICFAGSRDGRLPAALPDIPMTPTSSQAVRRASRSVSPDDRQASRMTAISGRKWLDLLHRSDPLLSLSRTLLTSSAWRSTECCLIWKPLATAHGRLLFRLVPSTRRTDATGSGLPPKPWATPQARDGEKGGPNMAFGAGGQPLPAQAAQALWPTPVSNDATGSTHCYSRGDHSKPVLKLPGAVLASGTMPDGSPGPMEKPAGSLNPEFVAYLMGYPPEWLECAPSRSSRGESPKGSAS